MCVVQGVWMGEGKEVVVRGLRQREEGEKEREIV